MWKRGKFKFRACLARIYVGKGGREGVVVPQYLDRRLYPSFKADRSQTNTL